MKNQTDRWRTNPVLWEQLKPIAHEKRLKPTEAEKALWKHLRMHQLHGLSFRSQHCVGQFIVDFYCKKAKLVIEVDGEIHQYQAEEDRLRQEYIESFGLKVLRFSNEMVLNNITDAMNQIKDYLSGII
jgi:very-short-patch-repair endonuclease